MRLPTPAEIWHERLQRALERAGHSRAVAEWANDLLVVRAHCPDFVRVDDDGRGRRVPNPAAGDDEATERATAELLDQMGVTLGIGPCPRGDSIP